MAALPGQEKGENPGLVPLKSITTTTTLLHEKTSSSTLASDTMPLAPSAAPRASNISTTPSAQTQANPFEPDIEAAVTNSEMIPSKSAPCKSGGTDCQVWPGRDHWKRKAKAAKMQRRNCNCLAHLSRRNRILVKILIGLLIVGIAVGVGVGVSKPLGAPIWHSGSS